PCSSRLPARCSPGILFMTLLLRSLTRWLRAKPRTIRKPVPNTKLRLLALEDRIAPAIGFTAIDTQDQLNLLGGFAAAPPNAMAAVGPNHIVENLNGSFAIYGKTVNLLNCYPIRCNTFFDPAYSGTDAIHFFY